MLFSQSDIKTHKKPYLPISVGTHSHATQANRSAFNFSLRYRLSLAIETLVKAISEVEGVFSQPTPEVDTSGLNDGSLHLIVRYGAATTGAADTNQDCGGD